MNLKDNYIIKSLKNRPVLFGLTFVFASLLTYMIVSDYDKRIYQV